MQVAKETGSAGETLTYANKNGVIGGVNMRNGERSGWGGRSDERVRLATGVGTCAGTAVALLLRRDLGGFWVGLLAFGIVTGVGGVLGRLVGGLLFRQSSGGPPGPPPHA
jgi:hypothetical protein